MFKKYSFTWTIVLSMIALAAFAEDLVDESYSLRADREALNSLRKDIPVDKKNENDEKAFIDQMMSDLSQPPMEVRNRFSKIVSKNRDNFNKDITKQRATFQKDQKDSRTKFSEELAKERKAIAIKKISSQERRAAYEETESKRQKFHLEQKEKRDDFEADIKDRRKNFEDYIKSKTDEFNQRHREYTKMHTENKQLLANQKKQNAVKAVEDKKALEKEYEAIKKQPPTILEPAVEK